MGWQLECRRPTLRGALQGQHQWFYQKQKRHEAGHGITGQPHKVGLPGRCFAPHMAIGERFSRFHGYLPQGKRPQRLHGGFDMVFFSYRDTPTGQNQVVVIGRRFERRNSGVTAVRDNAQIADFAAQSVQQSAQEKPVGVVN